MIRTLEKFTRALVGIEYWITVPFFIFMLGLMLMQVVCRYFLEIPLSFSEELARFVFVGITFLGGAIATAERGHLEINFTELAIARFCKHPRSRLRTAVGMNVLRDIGTIVCLAFVTRETWILVIDQYRMAQVSTAMAMPFWVITGIMFVGLALGILHSLALIVLNLSGRGPMGYAFVEGEQSTCSL